jgi:aspartyl-tRNA(Asn)/glutamyl-tRNA(Gln) amidotransferase subunit B
MSAPQFEVVIGLEVHCQLATDTKLFCGCRARPAHGGSVADAAPNSNTCPVCAGHPGTLPVLNAKVVEYAVKAGLATNCRINRRNVFARKNYFYPDLPKGYQISQYELPICEGGWLEIADSAAAGAGGGGSSARKRVDIQRIHMEEDAGKSVHKAGFSLVNLNRACVPLVEIVSGPDMRSAQEAGEYLRALYAIVTSLGICDGNLQEGNFRCDANVSIRPVGQAKLGTRTELKNINSFKFVEKAIEFETARQIQVVTSGGRVIQETRLYDSDKHVTISMRSKEEAEDYRYFPDPDLIAIEVSEEMIERARAQIPELPEQMKARFVSELGLSVEDAQVITGSRELVQFFETAVDHLERRGVARGKSGKPVANLLTGEVLRLLKDAGTELTESRLKPDHLADVVQLLQAQAISSTGAKQAIVSAWNTGDAISVIVEREGLKQVSDLGALEPIVDQVIAAHPSQVAEYRGGKDKLIGFFVGQVMKQSGGKANPGLLQEMIKKKLQS